MAHPAAGGTAADIRCEFQVIPVDLTMVSGMLVEVPCELWTATVAVPAADTRFVGMGWNKSTPFDPAEVANAIGRLVPFHCTVVDVSKPVPFKTMVKSLAPAI